MKKLFSIALCAALLVTQTACTGLELYERLLIHAVGVDWTEEAGYTLTVRSASAPGEEHEECFTCAGPTVAQALSTLVLTAGREPFYAHNYLVVFGEGCAAVLPDALDFFLRFHNVSPTVQLYLARGEASEVLTYEENGKLLPIARLQQLGEAQDASGLSLHVELLDFINTARRAGASPMLPRLALTEEGPRTEGAAFFREGELRGDLTGEDVQAFLLGKGRLRGGSVLLEDPALGQVTLAFTGSSARVETAPTDGGAAAFTLTLALQADAVSLSGGRERLDPEDYPLAEALLARRMEAALRTLWEKTAVRQGCDVLGLGAALYRAHPDAWLARESRWPALLPQCAIDIRLTAHISRLEKGGEGK